MDKEIGWIIAIYAHCIIDFFTIQSIQQRGIYQGRLYYDDNTLFSRFHYSHKRELSEKEGKLNITVLCTYGFIL